MPIVNQTNRFPEWCEDQHFEIIEFHEIEYMSFKRKGSKEKLMVAEGSCRISFAGKSREAQKGDQFDIVDPGAYFEISHASADLLCIRLCGEWGTELGAAGFFEMLAATPTGNDGDPVNYPRNTMFDNHYHDCDEYYVIYEGKGEVVTELKHYDFAAGDCVVIGKGHHHDIPYIYEGVKAIFFETTLTGQKRAGHLWNHTHGFAVPDWDRV